MVEEFEAALRSAGVEHRSITYPGAPHSFFDRTAVEHAEASAAAWAEVLSFIRERLGSSRG
jgi:carboxymethylenebutenolidase